MNYNDLPSPCFIIQEEKIRKNCERFKFIQDETGCKIILALKAFSTACVFPQIREYLSGCAASSINEVRLAKDYFSKDLYVYSPAYREDDFEIYAKHARHITFNSPTQWERFKNHHSLKKYNIQSGLRLNPEHSEVKQAIYDPCVRYSRLGITALELENVSLDGISGFHIHNLCGKGVESLERTLAALDEKFGPKLNQVEWLNLGGGHGITYDNYDVNRLCEVLKHFQAKFNLKIILEPGEAVVYNAGVLVSSVLDILKNEKEIAILDTSASTHMPDVIEMPYRPHIIGSGKENEFDHSYRLGGMTCLAGDIIGDYSFKEPLKIGDRLVFTDMAHYTMVKTTTFNGINLPAIARETEDGKILLEKEFSYSDFISRLV